VRIVLLGCPGAGKGTQAKVLCARFGLTHVSTGDLFRTEMAKASPLGKRVGDYVKKGMLVPDDVVVELVAATLDAVPGGWLLDGFPRTLAQAQALDKYLVSNGGKIDLVLSLAMREEAVVARLAGRWSCPACGEVFNLQSRPPQQAGVCDKCGGKLLQREDDTEATVRRRLMVYEDLTRPLAAYYRSEGNFQEVDGGQSPEDVARAVTAVVDGVHA